MERVLFKDLLFVLLVVILGMLIIHEVTYNPKDIDEDEVYLEQDHLSNGDISYGETFKWGYVTIKSETYMSYWMLNMELGDTVWYGFSVPFGEDVPASAKIAILEGFEIGDIVILDTNSGFVLAKADTIYTENDYYLVVDDKENLNNN